MNQNNISVPVPTDTSLQTFDAACGLIPYGLTNDYMFRTVLQANNKVLRGLICSLLHLSKDEVIFVDITNPVLSCIGAVPLTRRNTGRIIGK